LTITGVEEGLEREKAGIAHAAGKTENQVGGDGVLEIDLPVVSGCGGLAAAAGLLG